MFGYINFILFLMNRFLFWHAALYSSGNLHVSVTIHIHKQGFVFFSCQGKCWLHFQQTRFKPTNLSLENEYRASQTVCAFDTLICCCKHTDKKLQATFLCMFTLDRHKEQSAFGAPTSVADVTQSNRKFEWSTVVWYSDGKELAVEPHLPLPQEAHNLQNIL